MREPLPDSNQSTGTATSATRKKKKTLKLALNRRTTALVLERNEEHHGVNVPGYRSSFMPGPSLFLLRAPLSPQWLRIGGVKLEGETRQRQDEGYTGEGSTGIKMAQEN